MPQRINGIGTTYLGKSNVQTRPAECESCRRGVALSSYDTRLWFTFFWIPLIPLGRKRILEYCPSCTTHRALSLAEWEALKKKTMEEAARKALAEPANAEAQVELHRACLLMGEWEKADAFQKKLEEDFAKDAKTQLYLAGAHAYRGRGADAEAALARARALDPNIAPPEAPRTPVKPAPASKRPLVLLGILAVLVVGCMGVASVVKGGARQVYLVSGYDEAITVEIEGQPAFSVRGGGKLPFTVPEGRHRARVSGAIREDIDFSVESNFFTRLFDDRVFVLNPGGAAVCVVEETFYSAKTVNATVMPYQLHFGQGFFSVDDIDYEFAPFPSQIKTKESGVIRKRRVDLLREAPVPLVYGLLADKRRDDAVKLAEMTVRSRPADRGAMLPIYVSLAGDPALDLLRRLAAGRPVDVEVHRFYQRLRRAEGPALVAEYDAELAKAPKDPDLLYLRGRLDRRLADSRVWYEKALAENPKHPWAHYALGYGLSSNGDWVGAVAALEKAVEARPTPEFKTALRRARLGAGQFEAPKSELRAEVRKVPSLLVANQELARVLVAAGQVKEAKDLVEPFRAALKKANDPNADEHVRTLQEEIHYAAGEFDALLALNRPQALLEQGKIDEALKDADPDDVLFALAVAVARPEDAGAREKAAAALEAMDVDAAPLAKALRSGAEADLPEVLDASVDAPFKAAALAILAKRIPAKAAELRERAAKLNTLWTFPYHLLKRSLDGVK